MARNIAELLDGLPLALEQAGAFIAAHSLSFSEYLDAWERERLCVLRWHDKLEMSYPFSVAVTWQTSFKQLGSMSRAILQLISHLAAEPTPERMLTEGEEIVTAAIKLLGRVETHEPVGVTDGLAELARYCLVRRQGGDVVVPRMVQEVVRHQIHETKRDEWIGKTLEVVRSFAPHDSDDVTTWPIWNRLRPHVKQVLELAEEAKVEVETSALSWLMDRLGVLLRYNAVYSEAEPLCLRALEIRERSLDSNHPDIATSLHNLAELFRDRGRLEDAEKLHRRALAIREWNHGSWHSDVAWSLNNLAELLRLRNRLQEAEPLFRQALEINEKLGGPQHHHVGTVLNNLAMLLYDANRWEEAEPLIRRAVEINKKSYVPGHPNVATVFNNLAVLLQAKKRYEEAEDFLRQALEIVEKSCGRKHPRVAKALNNLAKLLQATHRLQEAEPSYRRALEICRKIYGAGHPYTQTCQRNLADLRSEILQLSTERR